MPVSCENCPILATARKDGVQTPTIESIVRTCGKGRIFCTQRAKSSVMTGFQTAGAQETPKTSAPYFCMAPE